MRIRDRDTFKNHKISFWNVKNLDVQPKSNAQTIRILNLLMNWNIYVLSFNVENKIDNLNKIRLLPF